MRKNMIKALIFLILICALNLSSGQVDPFYVHSKAMKKDIPKLELLAKFNKISDIVFYKFFNTKEK